MTSENDDFDAEAFAEEGMEEAGIEPDEQETAEQEPSGVMSKTDDSEDEAGEKPVETEQTKETSTEEVQAALEATETEEEEVESSIAEIMPQAPEPQQQEQEKADQRVPLEDHIKLRRRAQEAERELEELRRRAETDTPTGGEKPGEEVSPLKKFVQENPEEELVPASVQLEHEEWLEAKRNRQIEAARKAEEAALEAQRAATQQLQDFKTKADRAESSEKEVRKAHPDYDAVTKAAVKAKLLDDAERDAIFNAENPAEEYYNLCKGKLDAIRSGIGIPSTPTSESQQQANEEQQEEAEKEMTDDEIFDDVFGE